MGVLDDAIREHLDLKRRHGAREGELKELEDQAFGPPTRPGEPDFPEREEGAGEEVAVAEAPPVAEEPAVPEVEPEPAVPEAEEVEPEEPPTEEQQEAPAAAEPSAEAEVVEPEPAAIEEELGVEELDLSLDEEVEEEEEEEEGEEEEGEAEEGEAEEGEAEEEEEEFEDVEDVLEETPEFLRDAPESDDLWFEQGEPQDFDFEDEEE